MLLTEEGGHTEARQVRTADEHYSTRMIHRPAPCKNVRLIALIGCSMFLRTIADSRRGCKHLQKSVGL